MAKRCICLIRVSTQQQQLEGQREKVIKAAIDDGYNEDEIEIVEAKESAIKLSEEKRETLAKMKEIINNNPMIESVYVFALDRLARRVSTIIAVKEDLVERKINLTFLNPRRMSTMIKNDKGELVEDELTAMHLLFLSYGAQMEMNLKQARMKTAKDLLRKNNKIATGRPLFGYVKKDDKSVDRDEKLSGVVFNIFNDYAEHQKPMYDIYMDYVAKGIFKLKSKSAGKNTIRRILENKAYKGDYSRDDKIGNIKYPPIVSEELFDKVDSLIKARFNKPKSNHKYIYYGKGIITLTNTGDKMIAHITNLCYKSFEKIKCSININAMDTVIWTATCTLQMLSKEIEFYTIPNEYKNEISALEEQMNNIKPLLEKIHDRERKAFRTYMDGRVPDDIYNEEMKRIKEDEDTWNKEIAKLESEIKSYEMMAEEMREASVFNPRKLDSLDDSGRKKLINTLVKEVKLTLNDDGSFEIYIIPNDKRLEELYRVFTSSERYHYYTKAGKMYLSCIRNRPIKKLELINGEKVMVEKTSEVIDMSSSIVNRIGNKKLLFKSEAM